MKRRSSSLRILLSAGVMLCSGVAVHGQDGIVFREVGNPVKNDVSPPLRSMRPSWAGPVGNQEVLKKELPNAPHGSSNVPDPVVQSVAGDPANATAGAGFEGLGKGFPGYSVNLAPPDPNIAVGPNHIVQWVNLSFVVFNKAGVVLQGPTPGNTLWSGFGGACESQNSGDPIVQYDRLADRWLMTQFAIPSGGTYYQCIAVSTSPDPTGSYYRYAYTFSNMNDYPKFGVWPDGYYATFNMFQFGLFFVGARACAYDRNSMLNGLPAGYVCYQLSSAYGGLLPSDLDGSTPPPASSPNFVMNFDTNALNLWKFHVDWTTPGNSTFTRTSIPVAAFSTPCSGTRSCIPQPGVSDKLDSLADRLMYRVTYRNFGAHESVVLNHTVNAGSTVGVRWYEIRDPGGAPSVYQQGTFGPADGNYRWMGSVAMDNTGNIGLAYSVSGPSTYPSLRYTGHETADTLGSMQNESVMVNGTGSQTGTSSRWGDYSSLRIDPSDDCTFWYTGEYQATTASFSWNTRIGSFKFSSCGSAPISPPDGTPSGLTATTVSPSQINLSWIDGSTNESGFRIERCQGSGCSNFAEIATTGAGATAYNDTGLAASTSYSYRVRAYNSGGNSDYSNTASATTQAAPTPPTAPTGLAAANTTIGRAVILNWMDNSSDETSFVVERCQVGKNNSCAFSLLATTPANATPTATYTDSSVGRRKTYRYRVKARNSAGDSGYTNVASVTTN